MKILSFILVFIVFLVGCTQTNVQEISYADISSGELKELLDSEEDIFLVDVHIPEQEHIKGTDALIPFNEIETNLDKFPDDKDSKIVVYCRSGSMSRTASKTLTELGYTNVYNQLGGANDWREKGFAFE